MQENSVSVLRTNVPVCLQTMPPFCTLKGASLEKNVVVIIVTGVIITVLYCYIVFFKVSYPSKSLYNQEYIYSEGVKSIICFLPQDDLFFFLWLCGRGRRKGIRCCYQSRKLCPLSKYGKYETVQRLKTALYHHGVPLAVL